MQKSTSRKSGSEKGRFLKLCKGVSLRDLEEFYVYNKKSDELYEIDEKGCDFLKECDGSKKIFIGKDDAEFVDYCINEGILIDKKRPSTKRDIKVHSSTLKPSLRYLELLVTNKCNLACKHCYLRSGNSDLPVEAIEKTFNEFEDIGGIRLMVSGGEPLLHKDFRKINELIRRYDFRAILLTNGTLLNKCIVNNLNFNEVQVSIDGLKDTHDFIRGKGTFEKTLKAIPLLKDKGIDVTVATMILKRNVDELEKLNKLINKSGIKKWNVDVPCVLNDDDIFLDPEKAGRYFKYGFSSEGQAPGHYNSAIGYACGAHLMAVMNDGVVSKCSFFADKPVGYITDGLFDNYSHLKKIKLSELECNCDFVEECRGGCRYRAYMSGGINKRDKAKCGFYTHDRRL
jgi:radical SAM protein with 4Fe4S-binding SPASM domain